VAKLADAAIIIHMIKGMVLTPSCSAVFMAIGKIMAAAALLVMIDVKTDVTT